jgi:Raf kinase inhibitor-like YbhB/YbcL family protein
MALDLSSVAFQQEENIPAKYTCQGEDISPPLAWSGAPEGTQSYALVVDDPDAPNKVFTHWLIYNIPSDVTELPEGVPTDEKLTNRALQGSNDFGKIGYGGPCPPPDGPHRYRFNLYALSQALDLEPGTSKTQLLAAIERHILDQYELTGLFQRKHMAGIKYEDRDTV